MTMKRTICILTDMETEDSVLRGRSAQEPKEAFIARSSQTSRCELPGFWCHITCSRGGCFAQPSGWICRAWLWCQREMKAARLFKLFNCLKCFDTKVVAPTKSAGRIEGCSSSQILCKKILSVETEKEQEFPAVLWRCQVKSHSITTH